MVLNGSFRNKQAFCNFLFACAPCEQFRNFGFAFGKFHGIHNQAPHTSLMPYLANTFSTLCASSTFGMTLPFNRCKNAARVVTLNTTINSLRHAAISPWRNCNHPLLNENCSLYNRENDLYNFSKRNVHFSPFFAVRLPA